MIITGKLTPKRATPQPRQPTPPPPSRAARMLALAHHVEDLVERGVLEDYASAARKLGVTRARLSQIVDLILLAPRVQEGILADESRISERRLRASVREIVWGGQEAVHHGPPTR